MLKRKLKHQVTLVALLAMVSVVLTGLQTASDLAVTDAEAFIGDWDVVMQTPQGDATVQLSLVDVGGRVSATVTNEVAGTVNVSDISRSGENLVLRYAADMQGQPVPVSATLTPSGEGLDVSFEFGGQFTMVGKGVAK